MKPFAPIDLNFLQKKQAVAAFPVETSEGLALIESGPHSTFPALEAGLKAAGFSVDEVKHVFLTHIHFDHAGAAWALAERGATVYVHPFGEKHLLDPSKLVDSATRIYGEDMDRLWGKMKAIPSERLRAVGHEEAVQVGDTAFKSWHTPGHATHHIAWQVGGDLFTGDVAGVRIGRGPVVPPCPPPDVNLEDWKASIALIGQIGPKALHLTHFGRVTEIGTHLEELEAVLDSWAGWIKPHWEQGRKPEEVRPAFQAFVAEGLREKGLSEEEVAQYEAANPSWMSVAGLMRYWRKKAEREAAA